MQESDKPFPRAFLGALNEKWDGYTLSGAIGNAELAIAPLPRTLNRYKLSNLIAFFRLSLGLGEISSFSWI
jgi:hypothetical protein